MHEQTIAKKILEEAGKQGNVKKIVVECGELAHLPAKDLEQALTNIAPCEVEIVEKPAFVSCGACGHEGAPRIEMHGHDFSVFFCTKCGEVPVIIDGKDIILKSVEISK